MESKWGTSIRKFTLLRFLEIDLLIKDDSEVDVLVIGAGPAGLGAAKRLHQTVAFVPIHLDLQSSRALGRTFVAAH